ncbi:DUF3721 domain-containing protein [Prochlorococcus marinus]|uniref:DUF3721 domain-containing protein n=1 Tax=Prochlorococcus marinus TaxID=1219 RepID=UPI0022B4A2FC|nr:DUF3721 domain-containing protein [Prochlorococcus marinus]
MSPIFLIGCSSYNKENKIPAVFNTKTEAENAAKQFGCEGAHRMGNMWMPCKTHESHGKHKKIEHHSHPHVH